MRQWFKTGDVPQQGEVPQRQAADHFVPAPHHLVPLHAGWSFWWENLFSLLQVFPRYHPSLSLKAIKPWFEVKRGGFQVKELHTTVTFAILPARVLMLGAAGVGKTSLCSQFLSSANNNSYEPDSEAIEKEVSVSINNQETRLVFVDHTHGEISVSHGYIEMNGMSDLKVVQVPCCGLNSFQLFNGIEVETLR